MYLRNRSKTVNEASEESRDARAIQCPARKATEAGAVCKTVQGGHPEVASGESPVVSKSEVSQGTVSSTLDHKIDEASRSPTGKVDAKESSTYAERKARNRKKVQSYLAGRRAQSKAARIHQGDDVLDQHVKDVLDKGTYSGQSYKDFRGTFDHVSPGEELLLMERPKTNFATTEHRNDDKLTSSNLPDRVLPVVSGEEKPAFLQRLAGALGSDDLAELKMLLRARDSNTSVQVPHGRQPIIRGDEEEEEKLERVKRMASTSMILEIDEEGNILPSPSARVQGIEGGDGSTFETASNGASPNVIGVSYDGQSVEYADSTPVEPFKGVGIGAGTITEKFEELSSDEEADRQEMIAGAILMGNHGLCMREAQDEFVGTSSPARGSIQSARKRNKVHSGVRGAENETLPGTIGDHNILPTTGPTASLKSATGIFSVDILNKPMAGHPDEYMAEAQQEGDDLELLDLSEETGETMVDDLQSRREQNKPRLVDPFLLPQEKAMNELGLALDELDDETVEAEEHEGGVPKPAANLVDFLVGSESDSEDITSQSDSESGYVPSFGGLPS